MQVLRASLERPGYINEEVYRELYNALEVASKLLNGYCKGVINNAYDK